jgi:hypothetical protein
MIKTLIIEIAMRIIAIGFLNAAAVLLTAGWRREKREKREIQLKLWKDEVMDLLAERVT